MMAEYSIIDKNAIIGEGTRVWQFCNIMGGAVIGRNCNIGQGCFIESGVMIGNGVTVKNNISLYTGIECEDDVFLGPNCVFTNVKKPRAFISKKREFQKTLIKKGATIGANATILCGHTIGKYAMIGAGSVVVDNIPDYALVVGNPAKHVGYVCQCGERLAVMMNEEHMGGSEWTVCPICGKRYTLEDGIMRLCRA